MNADTKRLYRDMMSREVDIEDIVLQDHSRVKHLLPNITFRFNDDGDIIAQFPIKNEEELAQFIQDQEKKGYLVMGF